MINRCCLVRPLPLVALAIAVLPPSYGATAQIKVACLGEQTTHSFHRENDPEYPRFLGEILDPDFEADFTAQHPMGGGFLQGGESHYQIGNFGHPRGTVIDHALENPKAVLRSDELKLAETFQPDIVVLGPFGDHERLTEVSMDHFSSDLRRLIARIAAFESRPAILIALPLPRGPTDEDENYRRIRNETQQIATELELPIVDLWSEFLGRSEYYQDTTHLTVPGRRYPAEVVAGAVRLAAEARSR